MTTTVDGKASKVDPFSLPLLIGLILVGFAVAMCTFYLVLSVGTLEPSPISNWSVLKE